MTTDYTYAWDRPASDLVALHGGPRDHRWWFYRDWLTARLASRRGRYPLDHPCGSSRCYAPTTTFTSRTAAPDTDAQMTARVWAYISPAQWATWGREYLTPEETPTTAPAAFTPSTSSGTSKTSTEQVDTDVWTLWTEQEMAS